MRFLPPKTHTTHTKKPRHPAGLLGVLFIHDQTSLAIIGEATTVSSPVTTIARELAAP